MRYSGIKGIPARNDMSTPKERTHAHDFNVMAPAWLGNHWIQTSLPQTLHARQPILTPSFTGLRCRRLEGDDKRDDFFPSAPELLKSLRCPDGSVARPMNLFTVRLQ